MRLKRISFLMLIIGVSFLICISKAYGGEVENIEIATVEDKQEEILDYQLNFFNWEGIEALQKSLKANMPSKISFDLKEEVVSLIKGEKAFSLYSILQMIGQMLFQEIGIFMKLGVRFVLVVLLCNLLQTLSSSFQTKNTTKICFFVCYIVIIYSVIQSLLVMVDMSKDAIDAMSQVMFACIPTLMAFMATSGYVSSSSAMAPVIISALNISTTIIKNFIFPSIVSVIILQIMSTMSEEFKIDKLIKLFYSVMKWVLRGILVVSVSLLGIYKSTLPYVDMTVKKAALSLSSAFMPIIGDAVGSAVDFIVNCSFLVKNAFSIGVIIWVILIVSLPLIKILAYILVYYVAGAVIEPLGEKKMASIATSLAKGCEFIMSAVGIVALLCIMVLLICIGVGSNML